MINLQRVKKLSADKKFLPIKDGVQGTQSLAGFQRQSLWWGLGQSPNI